MGSLQCQVIFSEDHKVLEDNVICVMEKAEHDKVDLKDFAYALASINTITTYDGIVNPSL